MSAQDLLLAVALVFILEGLLPGLNPAAWRRVFEQALQMSDAQIRWVGLASMAGGLLLWNLVT